jgi:peptidoglycan/LPS O-acetylase OafA/YrhL
MNATNPIFAIIIYLIAILTAKLIHKLNKESNNENRFKNIDGLRGFLALGVFIHHASIWQQFIHTQKWEAPKSNLYIQFGNTGVALFFMITGFLFVTKLLNYKKDIFNWKSFFIQRFFRLFPMYIFSVLMMFIITFTITGWVLNVSYSDLFKTVFKLTTFTIFGNSTINGLDDSRFINAEVFWSLPYEWFFYIALPLISVFILKNKPHFIYIFISLIFVLGFIIARFDRIHYLLFFVGGSISPFIIKYLKLKINFNNFIISSVVIILFYLIIQFDSFNSIYYKITLTIIFILITLGNSIFGLLKSPILKFLGDISYSTYLIHGTLIYVFFNLIFGYEKAIRLTTNEYCLIIFGLTPILVLLSYMFFKYIELPFMIYSKKISKKIELI